MNASIIAQLLYLESSAQDKPITMYINSPGGSVQAGLGIYDTMNYISSPVSTVCIGLAASMGSLLLAGGEKGKRFALPHSSIMVHQLSGGQGRAQNSDIQIYADWTRRQDEKLNHIYKKNLTKPHTLEQIKLLLERDKWLDASQALELGVIDEIIDRRVAATGNEGGKS